jgi:hypothetical protein
MLICSCIRNATYTILQRLLKGHPNIVHLIDAAWHKMPNGLYEVFILMEFCAGISTSYIPCFMLIPHLRWWDN